MRTTRFKKTGSLHIHTRKHHVQFCRLHKGRNNYVVPKTTLCPYCNDTNKDLGLAFKYKAPPRIVV